MPDFSDLFNRKDSAAVGNNWKFKHKTEGQTAQPWRIVHNKAAPITDTSVSTIMYRHDPLQKPYTRYRATWKILTIAGNNPNAECIFRYTATGGQNNRRMAVVLTGAAGTLQRRSGSTTVTLASWPRIEDTDYTITVDVAGDTIVVYDTNFEGPDQLAATLSSSDNNDANGIGMGSGIFDEFYIDDITALLNTHLDLAPGAAEARMNVAVEISDPPGGDYPDARQRYSGVRVEPYSVVEGIPTATDGTIVPILCEITSATASDQLLPPATSVSLGEAYRFLPQTLTAESLTWGGGKDGLSWTINTQPAGDPEPRLSYTYSTIYGPLTRPALCFDGQGFLQLSTTSASPSKRTIAVTAVLHSGVGPSYGIFATDRSSFASPSGGALNLRYRHGRFELRAGAEVVGLNGHRLSGRPTIMLVSVDGDAGTGRLIIQDDRRMSRSFRVNYATFASGIFFGAAMENYDDFDEKVAADMDVLEVDIWEGTSLTDSQIDRYVRNLSAVYGVGL